MKTSFFFTLLLSFLFLSEISAQQPDDDDNDSNSGIGSQEESPSIGVVRGKVVDKRSNDPLPYASVALYTILDSTLATGSISAGDGNFVINKVPFGSYYAEVKFIGYNREFISKITISPEKFTSNIGEIRLTEASSELDGVTITGERSQVEYQLDKKVINVSENLNAMGASAARALENVPSITVDIDGNVALRGSTNFTVLIDGRPSPLEGSDALRQIPASAVDNIEIITNPSAKYEPDGLAGIINIITKKSALDGFSGVINTSIGTGDKYRGDFLINYKDDKVSLFMGADFTDDTRAGERDITQTTTMNDTTTYLVHNGSGPHIGQGYTLKGGLVYTLNEKNTLSLDGSYGYANHTSTSNEKFHGYTIPLSTDSYYLLNESESRFEDFYNMTLNYEKLFNAKGHKLTSYLYYSKEWGGESGYTNQYMTDENWNINDPDPYRIYVDGPGSENELRYQIDYVKPMGKVGKLESGYQIRHDLETENYYFNEWDNAASDWVLNPNFTNALVYTQTLHSVYGIYADQLFGIDYQFGLRGEYSFRSVKNEQSELPSELELYDYFPTIHLSRKIGEDDQFQINYSRRINRPRGYQLDPFVTYMNPTTVRVGNPDLLPEYVDSYEINYQKGLGKSWISLETYYRLTHDVMARATEVMEDGTRVLTVKNLNEEQAMGAELMLNLQLNEWFNFNLGGNLYRYKIDGTLLDTDVNTSSTNYDSRLNANFRVTPTTKLQIQGFYQGPTVTAQGRRDDFLMTSAAVKQDLFKEKLSATLQIQDIFGTAISSFTNVGDNFYDTITMKRETQIVTLTLSFRINNYKKQGGQNEDGAGGNGDSQQSDY